MSRLTGRGNRERECTVKTMENQREGVSALKAVVGSLLAILILIVAQSAAFAISEQVLGLGVPEAVCNVVAGMIYVGLALAGGALFCRKYLKQSMQEMRILPFQVKPVWLLSAFLMPALALLLSIFTGGRWEVHTFQTGTTLALITGAVAFYGLAAGAVEELIFRGLIMGCLEKRFGIRIAVFLPSVLFRALHIPGNHLDVVSTVQLLIAGSIVGILFSVIAYRTHSVWNSAVVHGVWNMAIIGGILHIGSSADSGAMFNFVLEHKTFLIAGGEFGIEASVISILVYLVFLAGAGRTKP